MSEKQAGRELDEDVAVKIMGWTRSATAPDGQSCPGGGSDWIISPSGIARCAVCEDDIIPYFSTSMKAAWTVAEKMGIGLAPILVYSGEGGPDATSRRAYAAFVSVLACSEQDFGWGSEHVYLGDIDNPWLEDTAPLAICRAALATVKPS